MKRLDFIELGEKQWLDLKRDPLLVSTSQIVRIVRNPFVEYHRRICRRQEFDEEFNPIALRRGKHDEPFIDRLYCEATGRETYNPGDFTVLFHPDIPWFYTTPDRIASYECPQARMVEFKGTLYRASDWKDGQIPEGAEAQNQGQMEIAGIHNGDLAVLAGYDFFVVPTEHDKEYMDGLLVYLQEFRERIRHGDPPDPDGTRESRDMLNRLHPDDNGMVMILTEEAEKLLQDYASAKEAMDAWEKGKNEAENALRAIIANYTYGETRDGERIALRTVERRPSVSVRFPPDVSEPEQRKLVSLLNKTLKRASKWQGIELHISKGSKYRRLIMLKEN